MSDTVLKIDNVSKLYRLGKVGATTLREDISRLWRATVGKENQHKNIGSVNALDQVAGDYVWALKDISLEIKRGDVVGIIGKNGAGKSTLLKILSKVTAPTEGEVFVKGRIASLLEVGTGMHPEMTGRENIFLNGTILGMKKAEIRSKFDEIVDFAGIAKYVDTPIKRYSSGMRVRLGFAVAAFLEPEILIVDEVLAVGDAEFQKKAIGKMQDISGAGGRTVLFVSHNMGSIENLCKSGVVLENGSIVYRGGQSEAIKYYLKSNFTDNQNRNGKSEGSLEIIIKDLVITNSEGGVIEYASTGEDIILQFFTDTNNRSLDHLGSLNFSFSFINSNGVIVFTHSNRFMDLKITSEQLTSSSVVEVELKEISLPRGTYRIVYNVYHSHDCIYKNDVGKEIEVVDKPFHDNLINPHPVHGVSLVKANWKIKN